MEEYWPLISMVVVVLAKFLNSKTRDWQDWPWYSKVFGLVLEVLDLWRPPQLKR